MVGARATLVFVSLFAVTLSGCTAQGAPFTEPAPDWQAGYTWSMETGFKYEWNETETDGESYTDSYFDETSEVLQILNTTTSIDGELFYIGVSKEEGNYYGYPRFFRQSDLASIYVDENLRSGDTDFSTYYELSEVPSYLHFPLKNGKTWSDEVVEGEGDEEIGIMHRSKVTGRETVDTPLGELDVVVIQKTVMLSNVQDALAAIREEIESEGGTVHHLSGDFRTNSTLRYSPQYQQVVHSWEESSSRFEYDIEFDGERDAGTSVSMGKEWSRITGARLQPVAEVPLESIAAYLSGDLIESPAGMVVEEVAEYTISIEEVRAEANVADGESVQFKAIVTGEMPDGHSLSWSATDLVGSNGGSGTGTSFSPTFTNPGVYAIELSASNGDMILATDSATALGHYRTSLDLTCGAVEAFGNGVPDDCASVMIPVRPGIEHLVIDATPSSPADDANRAWITLVDSQGTVHNANQYGEDDRMDLDESLLQSMAVAATDWELDWFQQVGIGETSVTMDIDLTYGGTVGTSTESAMRTAPLVHWPFVATSADFL